MSAPPTRKIEADLHDLLPYAVHLPDGCGKVNSRGKVHWCLACLYEWAYGQGHDKVGTGLNVGRSPISESDPTHNTVAGRARLVRACHDAARKIQGALSDLRAAESLLDEAMHRADPPHRTPEIDYPVGREVTKDDLLASRAAQGRRLERLEGWGSG